MRTLVYKKSKQKNVRKIIRLGGLSASIIGLILAMYTFFPLISYEIYIKPAFASQEFASPIPKTTIITQASIQSLLKNTAQQLSSIGNASDKNWLPNTSRYKEVGVTAQLSNYYLSIPKLGIANAYVSTTDNNVNVHLVHFPGTALPPNTGNAAIFGHSTLPQMFDPQNYKTIFATVLNLRAGDIINLTIGNQLYTYKVVDIRIISAEDTSYLTQDTDGSYLTIITCTPPGTTWKRLIIKAKLETT